MEKILKKKGKNSRLPELPVIKEEPLEEYLESSDEAPEAHDGI